MITGEVGIDDVPAAFEWLANPDEHCKILVVPDPLNRRAAVRIRLDPDDDLLHPVEEASNFNESRYYNFSGSGFGGWVRMGNRPNEGYAEMTVCLYLPDGRVGFIYKRPEIDGHTAHDAGGLRFEVIEPFVEHRVTYDGKVLVLAEPRDMADPRAAFAANPRVPCTIDLTHRAIARPWGGEPEWEEGETPPEIDPGELVRQGAHRAAHGRHRCGDRRRRALRADRRPRHARPLVGPAVLAEHLVVPVADREPRPRPRASPSLCPGRRTGGGAHTGSCGTALAMATTSGCRSAEVELRSEYDGEDFHHTVHAAVRTDDHTYDIEGTVWSNIPLRNRRESPDGEMLTTRIAEGMTTWRYADLVGSGLAEYLDQVVDGTPVGIADGA